jgi:hypothetical protein
MSLSNTLPFTPGTKSASASLAGLLGRQFRDSDGRIYVLAQAAAALTAMGSAVVVTAVASGVPTWQANTTTTANDPLVLGVCPATQVDLATGDYFLVQIAGYTTVICAASVAVGTSIVANGTAKTAGAVSATYAATTEASVFGRTLVASGAGGATVCSLKSRWFNWA